jgi:hypothetical protein
VNTQLQTNQTLTNTLNDISLELNVQKQVLDPLLTKSYKKKNKRISKYKRFRSLLVPLSVRLYICMLNKMWKIGSVLNSPKEVKLFSVIVKSIYSHPQTQSPNLCSPKSLNQLKVLSYSISLFSHLSLIFITSNMSTN